MEPPSKNVAIAIDGPAASGKSSVSLALARRLGFLHVNSGALYRGLTWDLLRRGVSAQDADAVRAVLPELRIECGEENGTSTLTLDGEDPGPHLSDEEVTRNVSAYSAIPELRDVVVKKLIAYCDLASVVMEGRDIGTVVFPETPYKFYIDASEEVRHARRQKQGLQDRIAERDKLDSSRRTAPLAVAADASVIDSSAMTIEEVVDEIMHQLNAKNPGGFAASPTS